MKTYATAGGVIKFRNKILILKRTPQRRSSPSKWETVSGFIKEYEAAEDTVLREVKEETGLKGKIGNKGRVFEVSDKWGRWIIVPFLIQVNSGKVRIDPKEHSEYKWVTSKEIKKFDCVAGMKKRLKSLSVL